MKQKAGYFTPAALTLSVVTAALAYGIPQGVPVRWALWLGAVSTVCLCILSALAAAALLNKAPSFAVRLALTAGLFMELAHIIVQAQGLCAAEFSSMALLGFLPLLLWAGRIPHPAPQAGTPRRGCCGGLPPWAALSACLGLQDSCTGTGCSPRHSRLEQTGAYRSMQNTLQEPFCAARGLLAARSGCRYGALRCRLLPCWAALCCLAAAHTPGWSCCGRGAAAAFPAWMRCFCCCGCCALSTGGHAVCRHPLALAAAGS